MPLENRTWPNLGVMSKNQYGQLLRTGMLWELFPASTGSYEKDCAGGENRGAEGISSKGTGWGDTIPKSRREGEKKS